MFQAPACFQIAQWMASCRTNIWMADHSLPYSSKSFGSQLPTDWRASPRTSKSSLSAKYWQDPCSSIFFLPVSATIKTLLSMCQVLIFYIFTQDQLYSEANVKHVLNKISVLTEVFVLRIMPCNGRQNNICVNIRLYETWNCPSWLIWTLIYKN